MNNILKGVGGMARQAIIERGVDTIEKNVGTIERNVGLIEMNVDTIESNVDTIEGNVDTLTNKDSRVKTAVISISSNSSDDLEYNVILNDFDSNFTISRYETGRYIISNSDLFSGGAERGGKITAYFYGGNTPLSYVQLLDSYQPGEAGIDCYKVTGYTNGDPVLVKVDSMTVVLTIKRYY